MKKEFKKFPLLICLIVSAVLIVSSLFVIGFAGLKFDTTLVGGSQVEVVLPDEANSQEFANEARVVCKHAGLSLYHTAVQDKFTAGEENGEYYKRVMVLTIANQNLSEEKQLEFRTELAEKLGVNIKLISEFETVTNMVEAKNLWFVLLSIGIIVACLFIFACIRYDMFAAISLLVAYLHNIILYFALSGICRLPIGLSTIAAMTILSFVMSAILIHIFEEFRKASRLHIDDKLTISEKMINSEKKVIKPYILIAAVVLFVALVLQLSPVFMVRLISLGILISLIICIYTTILVAPGLYAYLFDLGKTISESKLSRNETKNKVIKKKVAKNKKAIVKSKK